MHAVLLESRPSLQVGGVIHPHFMDENIEVQGRGAQVMQLVGDTERMQTWALNESSASLTELRHAWALSTTVTGLAASAVSLMQSAHSTYVPRPAASSPAPRLISSPRERVPR